MYPELAPYNPFKNLLSRIRRQIAERDLPPDMIIQGDNFTLPEELRRSANEHPLFGNF